MKKFFKIFSVVCFICSFLLLSCIQIISCKIPTDYIMTENTGTNIESYVPLKVKITSESDCVNLLYKDNVNNNYSAIAMFANIIPIKDINIHFSNDIHVIPCGNPFGIKLFTQGVMIVAISDVQTEDKLVSPARVSGLRKGDVIISMNGIEVNSNEDIAKVIEDCKGNKIKVIAKRNNMKFETNLIPEKSFADDLYKVGLWVRDSSAGIGTLTFYDQNNRIFAGLGHGVCDVDTLELLPLMHGDIVGANINDVLKATKGSPGELKGYFKNNKSIGNIIANTNTGVYGKMEDTPSNNEEVVVAMKQQVKPGSAKVLTTLHGDLPKYYDIEIINVNYNEYSPTKNMVVMIKDKELLECAGGIVQGMSGSPIIQNGMLVGAITHVFVNDPVRGYGIFAENMISEMQKLCISKYNLVS